MDPSPPESEDPGKADSKTEARAAEAAAIRRRWITLGEVLTVIAVTISALTLWNSWSERSDSEVTKSVEAQRASARAKTLLLTISSADKRELTLKPAAADQSVQSQTIVFPTALGAVPAETSGEPRIEAAWFEEALKKARNKASLPDDSRGDERLPVLIITHFLVDGDAQEDIALYDIGYTISGRLFGGHSLTLRGISLVARVEGDAARRKLDGRWMKLLSRHTANEP